MQALHLLQTFTTGNVAGNIEASYISPQVLEPPPPPFSLYTQALSVYIDTQSESESLSYLTLAYASIRQRKSAYVSIRHISH
jgi:hypothetical protein